MSEDETTGASPVAPPPPAWRWRAHYRDGVTWDELDPETGAERGFATVDLAQVAAIELIPNRPGLPNHIVLVDAPAGQRPIFFRRSHHYVPLDATTGEPNGPQQHVLTATVLGWQRTLPAPRRQKTNVAHFTAFFEDGSSFATDDRATLIARLHLIASLRMQSAEQSAAPPA